MKNIAKDAAKKARDRLLSNMSDSLNRLQTQILGRLDKLEGQVSKLEQELLSTQDQMLHQHLELRESQLNSGTIRLSDAEILTKTFSGLKIYLDPRDISVTPHLALDYIWEYNITKAWVSVVKPSDVVLDIGANFGYFGALAAQKTDKKQSKVVFFEPNPQLIPYINKTLAINWLNEQSAVENLAVSDKPGTATLNILKDYIGSSSLHTSEHIDAYMHSKMKVETENKIRVKTVTIDAYCEQQDIKSVDLIKMDIEGYEDRAYEGMRKIVQASPSVTLFIEFTKESYDNPKQFYEKMLADFGYVYLIDLAGKLHLQKDTEYESVIGSPADWIMPVFSKNPKLSHNEN